MKVRIYVQLKQGILDPQGKAVAGGLQQLGYAVNAVRVGREFILDLPCGSRAEAFELATAMCQKLLANPVTEDYRLEIGEE